MKTIEIVGLDIFYEKRYTNPTWIKFHKSMLESIQFSKLTSRQILVYYSLVFVAIEYKNCVPLELTWIKSKTNRKIFFADLEVFQALGMLRISDADTQKRIEENRREEKRREEKGREEKRKEEETSFLSEYKIQKPNSPVKEKLVSKYENLSEEEIEKFKKDFGMDPTKYLGMVKTV